MKKIIVVYGNSNTGKTTTIGNIYDELVKQKARVIKSKKRNDGDFTAVLYWRSLSIAISSMGDYRTTVDEYVRRFVKNDVFITALNKRFACIGSVWLEKAEVIYKIDKSKADDGDNQKVMNEVISRV